MSIASTNVTTTYSKFATQYTAKHLLKLLRSLKSRFGNLEIAVENFPQLSPSFPKRPEDELECAVGAAFSSIIQFGMDQRGSCNLY